MNEHQFVTLTEAKQIATELGEIGGGVRKYNPQTANETVEPDADDNQASGIYIPTYIGPFATPDSGNAHFFHLRFNNGADGFNAGLVKQTMLLFPSRWPLMIGSEVAAATRK